MLRFLQWYSLMPEKSRKSLSKTWLKNFTDRDRICHRDAAFNRWSNAVWFLAKVSATIRGNTRLASAHTCRHTWIFVTYSIIKINVVKNRGREGELSYLGWCGVFTYFTPIDSLVRSRTGITAIKLLARIDKDREISSISLSKTRWGMSKGLDNVAK